MTKNCKFFQRKSSSALTFHLNLSLFKYNKTKKKIIKELTICRTYFTPFHSIQKNLKGSVKQYPAKARIAIIS